MRRISLRPTDLSRLRSISRYGSVSSRHRWRRRSCHLEPVEDQTVPRAIITSQCHLLDGSRCDGRRRQEPDELHEKDAGLTTSWRRVQPGDARAVGTRESYPGVVAPGALVTSARSRPLRASGPAVGLANYHRLPKVALRRGEGRPVPATLPNWCCSGVALRNWI